MALGAAVSVAVMGRRTAVYKAALCGAVVGTLPDLDVLIDQGEPIANMVLHRAESHSLLWLTLASLPLAAGVARLLGPWALWRRWWLAVWLVLLTHPLLDVMTVYGTQLALPFTNHPFGVGSIFIIDPLYTLPLLVGTVWALVSTAKRPTGSAIAQGMAAPAGRGLRANFIGLTLSTAYLVWGVAAQAHTAKLAQTSLTAQGIEATHILVTPAPFNTLLWRVVAISGHHYHEGFYSLLDATPQIAFDRFDRGMALAPELQTNLGAQRIQRFSHGFYKLHEQDDGRVFITDLRMGQEPAYSFSFAIAQRGSGLKPLAKPEQVSQRVDLERGLAWLWRRMWGEPLPPPR